jgi:DNA-directed RNA polymerase
LADPAFYNDDANRLLPFAHADGVNALKAVPLRINQALLPLVDKFAVSVMRGDVKKLVDGRVVIGPDAKKLKADHRTVKDDLRDARWCDNETFYLDYNCDKRGRLNALQRLNYTREDHVRALFEFARGAPLTADGKGGVEALRWLEIHCANSYGDVHRPTGFSIDKRPWHDRVVWAKDNSDLIERVAADPKGSFERWRKADKPFAFVASCMELSRARKNPEGFETHLPIGFDGTANGLQHLVLLSFDRRSHNLATEREWEAARLVNLVDGDEPQDVYLVVTRRVMELLEAEDARLFSKRKGRVYPRGERGWEALDRDWNSIGFFSDKESAIAAVARLPKPEGKSKRDAWCFEFWRNQLSEMDEREKRKLLKTPVMTFPYSSTVGGMAEEMVDVYSDLSELNEPEDDAAIFLAKAVRLACQDILPGPTRIMKYIRKLALHRYHEGEDEFLEWISPTGFPFVNMYHKPKFVKLDLTGGVRSRYKVADGASPIRRKEKMLNAASPNYIQSLDAAHLIRTVLAANREGIRDILTVHDSYSCLAPFARPFGLIIRQEMAILHAMDALAALRKANVSDPNLLPLPQRGNIDPLGLQNAEYPFM